MVSVNQLVDIVEDIAGVKLKRRYQLDAPNGVRGRNSDNTLIRDVLGWAPSISLRDGMEQTYRWVYDQVKARAEGRPFSGGIDPSPATSRRCAGNTREHIGAALDRGAFF